ncbi:shufflon system plasmid conjugative transfer pilus tip adhesin PilV [Pseudomonas sp. S5F11]|jgi:type II secretory pathway pseudopilin PulG|uniref:shufflon system plasmid conjugative transfer pilus tip adhesin PilV n=1 Tax=Pseudomonas sp. S5F11 TaxID=2866385 RepID=UPI001C7CAC32|nr:shufflon system plasmid conjugative transfer pilus tip adhesin PilV [Pseudomonas sp. S5F11]MBX4139594.1 shufflon system plasmid conjugative transfer pilus tip adhesin PilV [Pseudomonas sp. S5F11]
MEVVNVKSRTQNKQAGFIAIEVMFVIIVFVVMSAIGAQQLSRHMDSQNYQIAAQQQQAVADAAAKYLKDYFSTVVASATPTVPVQITVAMLRNTKYLPIGFGDTNAFGQTFLVLARSPAPNQLESIVLTTGGETIDEIGTREIAENLGGTGGFIPVSNNGIVQGVRGGWQIALSNYGMNPGTGHTASALFLQDGTLTNDYLYRNAVPGHPEVNAMNTSINLNGNDLNAVKNTNTATLNAETTNTTGETTTGGWFRTKGDTGWLNEKWLGGWYMNDPDWLRSYGDKGVTTGGEMRAGKLTSTGRTQVGEYLQLDGVAVEGAACTPNGLIGRNAAGLALSCQSGLWKGSAGKDRWGGSFWTASHQPGGCAAANPFTGSCSCPAGYTPNSQFAVAIGGCNPCAAYSCYKLD